MGSNTLSVEGAVKMNEDGVKNGCSLFMDNRHKLMKKLTLLFVELNIGTAPVLETPPKGMGDLALPCFSLARELKKSPAVIVADLTEAMNTKMGDMKNIFHVESKGPYVNFTYRDDYLMRTVLPNVLKRGKEYGSFPGLEGRIILEHTSANPNGPFHVGRARNPIIGDTLARVLRKRGHDVEVQYWVNDMGRQAATLAWGKKNITLEANTAGDFGIDGNGFSEKPDHMLVPYYQKAHSRIRENPELESEIDNILLRIEEGDREIKDYVQHYAKKVLEGMKGTLEGLNIMHDKFVWESQSVESGSVGKVISTLSESSYAYATEGAWYLELEDFGIQGRSTKFFFTRGDGTSLYTTRDLAYHLDKMKEANRLINVLGEDHKLQAKQLNIALELLDARILPESVFYSFVSLEDGKMSTRKGQVVYLDDLISEAVHRAYLEVLRRRPELDEDRKKEIAEIVGLGCIRYNIIRVQPDKKITFRWSDALNFDGDSSPFMQYAHARCCGILDKAEEKGIVTPEPSELDKIFDDLHDLGYHPSEVEIIKKIAEFPDVVREVSETFKLHRIPEYLQEAASAFNTFYQDCPVLKDEPNGQDEQRRRFRLCIVKASRTVIAEGLVLLGISAPRSM